MVKVLKGASRIYLLAFMAEVWLRQALSDLKIRTDIVWIFFFQTLLNEEAGGISDCAHKHG